jgi:hypothetical protein
MAGGGKDDKYTYDLEQADGGPRLPTEDDFGGDQMVDDPEEQPQFLVDMTAGGDNERNRNLAGLNRVNPRCRIWVDFSAGPTILHVKAMGTLLDETTFTPTPQATGHLRLSWPAWTLPAQECPPKAALNEGPGMIHAQLVTGSPLAVDVFTYDATGTLADLAFNVDLH